MGDDSYDPGRMVQIQDFDDEYVASSGGISAHGPTPGEAVTALYEKLD